MSDTLVIKCPQCGKTVEYRKSEFRPFCSERCKLLDLGAWADEAYSLPVEGADLGPEDIEALQKTLEDRTDGDNDV